MTNSYPTNDFLQKPHLEQFQNPFNHLNILHFDHSTPEPNANCEAQLLSVYLHCQS